MPTKPVKAIHPYKVIAVLFIIILVLFKMCSNGTNEPSVPTAEDSTKEIRTNAIVYAQEEVKKFCKDPDSFDPSWVPDNVITGDDSTFIIMSHFHANNGMGLKVYSHYNVKLKYLGGSINDNNNWSIISVYIDDQQME
jgi:hypothetical protein